MIPDPEGAFDVFDPVFPSIGARADNKHYSERRSGKPRGKGASGGSWTMVGKLKEVIK